MTRTKIKKVKNRWILQTVILNGGINNYLLSTAKVFPGMYETAIFPIKINRELDFPLTYFYDTKWDEIDRVNCNNWLGALWNHLIWLKNWDLKKKDLF